MTNDDIKQRREALFTRLLRTDRRRGAGLESAGRPSIESAARNFDADDVTNRLESLADSLPAHEVVDPGKTKRAAELVARNLRSALAKARRGDLQSITEEEEASTEAVIIADGSRPTLLLQNGLPPLDHPMLGDWRDEMTGLKQQIAQSAAATCRVQPTGGSPNNYFGTGFLIDAARGLVLTNQHVLNAMLSEGSTDAERSGLRHIIRDGVVVEFNGEADMPEKRQFKVVEAHRTPVDVEGLFDVNFKRLDISVLKIEPLADSPSLPAAVPLELGTERADGGLISFCSIGFPGPPESAFGVVNGIDFGVVHSQLFGGRYGLKRIAPGLVHRPVGTLEGDPHRWVFGHNATMLGGASGSPVIAWLDGNSIIGIHFAGQTGASNFAHSLFAARRTLAEFDLPLV
ncbi:MULTISPECIES: serine protease [Rhodomicrobium]|uniref:trypsin-like serine peptidase n=1 Tax=Rhodomicrobium TaxID=1068 RepID=UPI001482A10C|nr:MULTISPECIES: serine protease [Rhodomicrobium]